MVPDVRSTWTAHAGGTYRWHYVLAAQLESPFTLTAAQLGPALSASGYLVFDYFNPLGGPVGSLDALHNFTIPTGTGQPSAPAAAHAIRYYIVAPLLSNGWSLLGELGKVTPMAAARTSNLQVAADGFTASIAGSAGEPQGLTFAVLPPSSVLASVVQRHDATTSNGIVQVACPSKAGSSATLACSASGCKCA